MPRYFSHWGDTWIKKHPAWTMRLWTEKDIAHFTNSDIHAKCATLEMRADLVRYEVVYREGGVYLDPDMECMKNIDMLIQGIEFFGCWNHTDILSNAIFGSSKGNKILQSIVWGCRKEFKPEPPNAMGPEYFTKKVLGQPDVRIYPRETFLPYTREQYKAFPKHPMTITNPPPESFAINHRSSVWYKDKTAPLLSVKKT